MWLRRLFYRWLFPAAVILPAWLLVGWGVFQAGGWAFLWVLFIAIPSVFLGQIILTLLVRARTTVRIDRALSWADVVGFTIWHGLIIATGFYSPSWFAAALVCAMFAAIGLFWSTLVQLWREARASSIVLRTPDGAGYIPPVRPRSTRVTDEEVVVLEERKSGS